MSGEALSPSLLPTLTSSLPIDEEYEILSELPETVEFVCRLCLAPGEAEVGSWDSAVKQFKTEAFDKVQHILTNYKHTH